MNSLILIFAIILTTYNINGMTIGYLENNNNNLLPTQQKNEQEELAKEEDIQNVSYILKSQDQINPFLLNEKEEKEEEQDYNLNRLAKRYRFDKRYRYDKRYRFDKRYRYDE